MTGEIAAIERFLETAHPYGDLPRPVLMRLAGLCTSRAVAVGQAIYRHGEPLSCLYLIMEGRVEIADSAGAVLSELSAGDSFGERGLLADGLAVTGATALTDAVLLLLPAETFLDLMASEPVFARFFSRGAASRPFSDVGLRKASDFMSYPPIVCTPSDTARQAAEIMRDRKVSCLGVVEENRLVGIVTLRDLAEKVVAMDHLPGTLTIGGIMTPNPVGLGQDDLVSDGLHLMMERHIGHLPVVDGERLVGMITKTDLTRFQANSTAQIIREIALANDITALRQATRHIPGLLVQLVGGHNTHDIISRLITDITDAVTRRLVALALTELGAPPVAFLWLACGSQGRQEQTGVSDQDNCLILDDGFTEDMRPWFKRFASFVSDGLDACGYIYCPGDMMATNPRWCQPLRIWRDYFRDWIDRPDPTAQMLASVMFDLRPIAGETALFSGLHAQTLELAGSNSIFIAHMAANALKHTPPLSLLRGFATFRSGDHRHQIDLKHNGTVPVIDLARIHALSGQLLPVNSRARLLAAENAGLVVRADAQDLLAAYDFIADTRLRHQALQISQGKQPDNYLAPYDLGTFERSQLRDAFVVVRGMQSILASRGAGRI